MQKFENIFETETLCMSKGLMERGDNTGYWLYDETRGMNLGMRAKTEREAFIEAIEYYQNRLKTVEEELSSIKGKVSAFVEQFTQNEDY